MQRFCELSTIGVIIMSALEDEKEDREKKRLTKRMPFDKEANMETVWHELQL